MKRLVCIFFLLSVFAILWSQDEETSAVAVQSGSGNELQASDFIPNAQVAMSSPGYLVTPGDVYTIAYAAGTEAVSFTILVDASYKIRVANLAVIDANGKTFLELKTQVEAIVSRNYPMSGVQFVLLNPSQFRVTIQGEVKATAEPTAWPLTRLSTIITPCLTGFSSIRDISIRSANGKTRTFDLFKFTRNADMTQNPFVRPGDVITINRYQRTVSVTGAVERPGTYQLLEGEGLDELISTYGNGLIPTADSSRIELVRKLDTIDSAGNRIFLGNKDIEENYMLKNLDAVFIPSLTDQMPVLFVEGAVGTAISSDLQTATKLSVRFFDGENYATLVRRNHNWFNPASDTTRAYVIRDGVNIPVNLDLMLYNASYMSTVFVVNNDILYIPFKQTFANITVNGEVTQTVEKPGWPLVRLSALVSDVLTSYSSTRDIILTTVDGKKTIYDLFKYTRDGDMTQNPYVRPGETVTVNRMSRQVTIEGAVERPGTYQLKDGEGLADLISYYGHNLTPLADTSRLELVRHIGAESDSGNKMYLDEKAIEANYNLMHFDTVTVPQITELMPVMFVEGAVGIAADAKLETSNRVTVRFNQGENYASLIRKNINWFTSVSDTKNAYIIRNDKMISVNLNPMLYDATYHSDYVVEPYDVLIIPFRQYFVTVSGAVNVPGRYPYIPDRDWSYYIALAGGFIPGRNSMDSVVITDLTGKNLRKDDPIAPETIIKANNNAFTYYFNQYAPVITTTLSIISTYLTVMAATGNL